MMLLLLLLLPLVLGDAASGEHHFCGRASRDPFGVWWNVGQPFLQWDAQVTRFLAQPGRLSVTGWRGALGGWTQGSWPYFERNGTARNGGLPQLGNLTLHLERLRSEPPPVDADFEGMVVFDFENWSPVWEQNVNTALWWWHSIAYQTASLELERKLHPTWPQEQIEAQAKASFEEAATLWMVESLRVLREVRPRAQVGFYGLPAAPFPPCNATACSYDGPAGAGYWEQAERMRPILEAGTAVFPSIYIPGGHAHAQNALFIRAVVNASLSFGRPAYPFVMGLYHNHTAMLTADDMQISLQIPLQMGCRGVMFWGGENLAPWHLAALWNETYGPLVRQAVKKGCSLVA